MTLHSPVRSVQLPPQLEPDPLLDAATAGEQLADFLRRHPRTLVLTGAGVSTDSGIPDYRDDQGGWKRKPPVQHQVFMGDAAMRQRYWGRSLIGWPLMKRAQPNPAHFYLAQLEQRGFVSGLITQNVDGLHQQAGSRSVIDLHGRADAVICMSCGYQCSRADVHQRCDELNPDYRHYQAEVAPDGDADLEVDFSRFVVANCPQCDGLLKPDVVFFGDNVPRERVADAFAQLAEADALLVVGSSMMVYSGFRFCRQAHQAGQPLAVLNLGRTRADPLVDLKLNSRIAEALAVAVELL
ncbi:NAD-dependent protein deacetylase [Saccharospirillum mangrovi]|uniref:NAD-dependent protein deacetylase n=1 Tax=Saccharospirillum mangrovi TaxID=2161747 RepID=UPI000D3D6724|nr:NAD-dependent protein deacetylase [Saccharospirillum mangrovi]